MSTQARVRTVLVQAGHVPPREPGFESGTGTVREQEFTRKLRDALCEMLEADPRFRPVPVPGDIPDGIKVDAAIFEHGDGSANPAARGTSFGYPDHPTNKKLAALIRAEYERIPGHPPRHADNYTGGLTGYYGYRRVVTDGPEVLVESGFLTNPQEQRWLFAHVPELARAQYLALLKYYGLGAAQQGGWQPGDPPWQDLPGVPRDEHGAYPAWLYPALAEYVRRLRLEA